MCSLPDPGVQVWADEFVGGTTDDPAILHLVEENLMTNGDFESAISGWSNDAGTAPSRVDAGSLAAKGNYVMRLQTASITHRAVSFTGTKILLTGFVKFIDTDAAGSFDIDLYITANSTYVAAPAVKSISVTINSEDAIVDETGYFAPFYAELEAVAGSYVHINFGCDASVEVYLDDLRLYEVSKNISLYKPNRLSVRHKVIVDADYVMYDGSKKAYVKGWRPIYSIGYDYIDAAGVVNTIGVSESMFNFFIPHSNNLNGNYVRGVNDFSAPPFRGRYLGHEQNLELESIFIQKYKSREYGTSYFSVTANT